MLNFGIIGTGSIASDAHGPALSRIPGVQLWSVLSRDPARGDRFAQQFGAKSPRPSHTALESFLSDPELHAVIVASPDRLHHSHILACAEARKHVLVEKPMTTEVVDGEHAIRACREAGVKLGVGFHLRWHVAHRRIRERIMEGVLGQLQHVRIHWTFKAPDDRNWRASEQFGRWWSLAAHGVHCLDLIRWFLQPSCGDIVHRRSILTRNQWGGPHEESALLSLSFANGATAELLTSVLFDSPPRLEIYGLEGYAVLEGTLGRYGKGSAWMRGEAYPFVPRSPFDGEIADFAAAILQDHEPEVTGEIGLQVIRDLELAAIPSYDAVDREQ
jgi:predicted dehydrogenase